MAKFISLSTFESDAGDLNEFSIFVENKDTREADIVI